MKNYELTVVFDGKLTVAKRKTAIDNLKQFIENLGGKIVEAKQIGEKELAYPINKANKGFYLFYNLDLTPGAAGKISDKLRIEDNIIRFLLISQSK